MARLPFALTVLAIAASSCASQIQHGLDERDANELISVLTSRGFEVRKVAEKGKKPTWAIEVDDEHATDALRVLAELKLPRAQKLTTAKLAAENALIETPGVERLRQLEGQEGDLEQSLEMIDGVTSASVELVVPLSGRGPPSPSKASVLLRVSAESIERLGRQRADLRGLVAASVDGLTTDDVVLVIDEVQARVDVVPAVSPQVRLRRVIVAMGALLTFLALGLVAMAGRLRSQQRALELSTVSTTRAVASAPRPKPVVAASVQRKPLAKESLV